MAEHAGDKSRAAARPERARVWRVFALLCWLALAMPVSAWALVRLAADQRWPATFLVYGPPWVFAVPALVLLPVAALRRRQLLWPLAIALVVTAVPLMGFTVPWRPDSSAGAGQTSPGNVLRLMTCNVEGGEGDATVLLPLLRRAAPDVAVFQEWGQQEAAAAALRQLGWQVVEHRGLAMATHFQVIAAEPIASEEGWRDIAVVYTLRTPGGPLHVTNVHLETPRKGIEAIMERRRAGIVEMRANIDRRRRESVVVRAMIDRVAPDSLVGGDFNMVAESRIFREVWQNRTDAFNARGWGFGHTKFTRWWGTRIDHILAGPAWAVRACRTLDVDYGSSHHAVFAELSRTVAPSQ
jgi:endonuclease/exonuclease/phosphatase family metal-dependent hydrolase